MYFENASHQYALTSKTTPTNTCWHTTSAHLSLGLQKLPERALVSVGQAGQGAPWAIVNIAVVGRWRRWQRSGRMGRARALNIGTAGSRDTDQVTAAAIFRDRETRPIA